MNYNPDIVINEHCKIENSILTCQLQNGPIKEFGINGCQIDDILSLSFEIINHFNDRFPCVENVKCLEHLHLSIDALLERKKNRELRGVEGKDKL
jgi:hypothetical protein